MAHPYLTVLDYVIKAKGTSFSAVGKELNITPQQFSDWVKKRRPIPAKRLSSLSEFLGIQADMLTDEGQYAKELNPALEIDIRMQLIHQTGDEKSETQLAQLQEEKSRLEIVERVKRLLGRKDSKSADMLSAVLTELEKW
ncbi:hypothetical protein LRR81_04920 [Metabacillus sp. GX 13764]|uniref:hypothetical protein n=1 Tax=Metabacillus kandeliae TaxID=2900151 RepID=UPI001E516B22|nr:hypothetical protein [Metabacillus kandeliae]MCD7033565.1 hypothetical protein [Metabacillus kandeliae]